MALARARRDSGMNYWPGFVDALSTLILGIIFLLTVFVLVQFYLTQEVTGKDTALNRLNAQIAQLTELLSLEKTGKLSLEEQLTMLQSSLTTAESERDRYKGLYDGVGGAAQGKAELSGQLDAEKRISTRALAQVEVLNQQIAALRRQLSALEEALDASDSMWRSPNACKNSRAIVPTSSAGCAPSSAIGPTFASSATASCSSRKCSSIPPRLASTTPRAAPNSTDLPPRCSSSKRRFPARSRGCCASTATPTCGVSTARSSRTTGSCRSRARSRSCNTSSARAYPRNGSSRPVSASFSRSTPTRPRKPIAATAASSSS